MLRWHRGGRIWVCLGVAGIWVGHPWVIGVPLRVAVLPRDGRASQRWRRGKEGGGDAALALGWTNLGVPGCGCG